MKRVECIAMLYPELDDKLAAAVAPLATKADLAADLAAAIAPLATKAELTAAIAASEQRMFDEIGRATRTILEHVTHQTTIFTEVRAGDLAQIGEMRVRLGEHVTDSSIHVQPRTAPRRAARSRRPRAK